MEIKKENQDSRLMHFIFATSLALYIMIYCFESPIRYGLNLVGLDALIFLRDVIILVPIMLVFFVQLFNKKIAPYFFIYAFIVLFHGLVMIINTGSFISVIYSAKVLISMLYGAIIAPLIFSPHRKMLFFYVCIWVFSTVMIFLSKYYIDFPWADLKTSLFGVEVEVSRDWTLTGAAKRASGMFRSSISAGSLMPVLSLILIFNFKHILIRLFIITATLFTIYLTTMKGSLIAFFIVSLLILGSFAIKFVHTSRVWLVISIILMIVFPMVLPGYNMPSAEGQFSLGSFNMRVEEMWPEAWAWINSRATFPFGVGLGGIGGAQRFYAPDDFNASDNMFIFLYANFGVFSYFYLLFPILLVLRLSRDSDSKTQHGLATLIFLTTYGIVIAIIESLMCNLFLGAAVTWIASQQQKQSLAEKHLNSEC